MVLCMSVMSVNAILRLVDDCDEYSFWVVVCLESPELFLVFFKQNPKFSLVFSILEIFCPAPRFYIRVSVSPSTCRDAFEGTKI